MSLSDTGWFALSGQDGNPTITRSGRKTVFRNLRWIFCALALVLIASPLTAQIRFKYKCISDGRYTKRMNKGPKHYCWDGTYYSEKTAPQYVKDFFNNLSAGQPNAALSGRRRAERPTQNAVEASTKPEPVPITAELLRSIEVGADRAAVLDKLGTPHGRLANAGEDGSTEVWTYVLTSGAFAKVRLEAEKVVAVNIPQ